MRLESQDSTEPTTGHGRNCQLNHPGPTTSDEDESRDSRELETEVKVKVLILEPAAQFAILLSARLYDD